MKKLSILLVIVILISSVLIAIPSISAAKQDIGFVENYDPNNSSIGIEADTIVEHISPIYSILYTVAVVVSVITVMIVGVKFIGASAMEKAEYKKHLIPIAVGILLICFLLTLITIAFNIASTL